MKTANLPRHLPRDFDQLAQLMVPHAIEDEADYEDVAEWVSRLAVIARPTRGQRQYLDTLSQLIEAYDNQHNAVDTSDFTPLSILKSLLDDHELTASDLGRLLGNRELGSKILRGERQLSKANIRKLADHFKISPAAFMD